MKSRVQRALTVVLLSVLSIHSFSVVGSPAKVPFELCQDYLVVIRGSVGQVTNIRMVIDTGAACTVITNRKIVRRLGLSSDKVEAIDLFGPKREVEEVILPDVRIGPLYASDLPVMVTDLYDHHRRETPFDMIIGLDILRQANFVIDYESGAIEFGAGETLPEVASFDSGSEFIVVHLLQNRKKLRLIVDTAAPNLVLYQGCLEQYQIQLKRSPVEYVQNSRKVFQQRGVLLGRVQFGSGYWRTLEAVVIEAPAPEEFHFDGLLGPRSLGLKKMSVDFDRQRMSWKK